MADEEYSTEQIAAYGATAQPAIAARMTPHLRMTLIGAACAGLAVLTSLAALLTFPMFSDRDTGAGWAVVALVSAVLMLVVCGIQVAVWRRAMASWRGVRMQDLQGERRLSWITHLVSYAVVLAGMWACLAGPDDGVDHRRSGARGRAVSAAQRPTRHRSGSHAPAGATGRSAPRAPPSLIISGLVGG